MALPTTLTDITFLATASQGRTRPYISSAGNVYYFAKDGGTTTQLNAYKATDPASSFSQAATLAINASGILLGIGTFQDGDNIHIATQDDNEAILYHVFSMSSDTFTTSNEAATSAVGTNIDADKAISISLETDGSIIIFYQAASVGDMGAKERVNYAYKPSGGSWTVDQAVDAGGAINYYLGGIVRGEADKFHLVFKDDNNSDALHRSVQDVDGTLSAVETLNDSNTNTQSFIVTQPVYYDDDGVERITTFFQIPNNIFTSVIDDDGTPQDDEFILGTTEFNGEFTIFSGAVDEKTVWALLAQNLDDLFFDSNVDNTGWGNGGEELDAITCNLITSNVYERNGVVVLAYVYDDGGTIKYNEKFLRIASNSAFADARLPRQNYHIGPFEF